jgi:hypothetical protein
MHRKNILIIAALSGMVVKVLTCEAIGIPLTQSQRPPDQSKTPALLFDPSNPAHVK